MTIYVQKDGNSKGQRVEVMKEEDYKMQLKNVANNLEFTVGKIDFQRHYLDEATGAEPKVTFAISKSEETSEKETSDKPKYKKSGKKGFLKNWVKKHTDGEKT